MAPRPLRRSMRRLRQQLARRRYPARVIVHEYGGVELSVHIEDPIADAWYDQDYPELPEIALLRRGGLRKGATVFDIGGHQAVVALMLAHVVGPGGRVVVVEASAHDVAVARKNVASNGADNVTIVHAVCGESPGTARFGLDGSVDAGSGEWASVEVPAVTVDGLAEEHGPPDVLFVDVEGFESHVLRGARDARARRPDVFVEIHDPEQVARFGRTVGDTLVQFPREEYDLYASEPEGEFRPLDEVPELLSKRFFLVALARPR